MRRLLPLVIALVALASLTARADEGARGEASIAVRELLIEQRAAGHLLDEGVVASLRQLGSRDPQPLVSILLAGSFEVPGSRLESEEPEIQVLNRYQQEVSLLALGGASRESVTVLLPTEQQLRTADEATIATTLAILGATERGRSAGRILRLARVAPKGAEPEDLSYERREALRSALALLVEREGAAATEELTRQLSSASPIEKLAIVQATGDSESPHGLALLLNGLQTRAGPVDLLASQVARIGQSLSARLNDAVAAELVEQLGSADVNSRRQIARALGALECRTGVEALVDLLEDEDSNVGEMAHRALQACARIQLPRSVKLWNDLLDRELVLEGRSAKLARELKGSSASSLAENARKLAGATIARHTLAAELGALASSEREMFRNTVVNLLLQFDSVEVVDPLVRALQRYPDSEPILEALRSITGLDLGPDAVEWQLALDETRPRY